METIGDCIKSGKWIHYIDTGESYIYNNEPEYQIALNELINAKPKDKAYKYKLVYAKVKAQGDTQQ